jgi:hypothetical protein
MREPPIAVSSPLSPLERLRGSGHHGDAVRGLDARGLDPHVRRLEARPQAEDGTKHQVADGLRLQPKSCPMSSDPPMRATRAQRDDREGIR